MSDVEIEKRYSRHKSITRDEETSLLKAYNKEKSIDVVEQIICAYTKMIYKIARKRALGRHDIEDLVQEGTIGLIAAIDRYDPSKGNRFSTLAYSYIDFYILDYLYDNASVLKMPKTKSCAKIFFSISKYLDSSKDIAECIKNMSNDLCVSSHDVMEVLNAYMNVIDLDHQPEIEKDDMYDNEIMLDYSLSPETVIENKINNMVLYKSIQFILEYGNPKTRDIIESRYLKDETEKLKDIAARHNLTLQRIQQIEKDLISSIRAPLKKFMTEAARLNSSI
jgi:RNA polymerase sigma-32 factor